MICPICKREETRSTVYDPGYGASTAMMVQRYWDEDGKLHIHDPNHHSTEFHCSLGHRWSVSSINACPAGDRPGRVSITER